MEEFSALAARVAASVGDLRGVLILSRDGLVLGAFPEGDEALVKPAWLRFAALGEPDKGFVEFGDEVWAYMRRGPYASFAVTGSRVRPGLVMDQLEQMLLAAEEIRARREALRLPDVAPAPSGKPRTSLHAEAKPAPQSVASSAPAAAAPPAAGGAPPRPGVQPPQAPAAPTRPGAPLGGGPAGLSARQPSATPPPAPPVAPTPDVSGPPSVPSPAPGPDGGPERSRPPEVARPVPAPARAPAEDEGEVDPVLLAQEFSRLLQETGEADET